MSGKTDLLQRGSLGGWKHSVLVLLVAMGLCSKHTELLGMVAHLCNLALGRQRWVDLFELEANLVNTAGFR